MRMDPRHPHICQVYSLCLAMQNRFEEAIAARKRAVELDPWMPFWNSMLACIYMCSRRHHDAVAQAGATLDLVPNFWWARVWGGLSLAALGRLTEARAALEQAVAESHGMPYAIGWLGFVLARAGLRDAADAQLHVLLDRARRPAVRSAVRRPPPPRVRNLERSAFRVPCSGFVFQAPRTPEHGTRTSNTNAEPGTENAEPVCECSRILKP